MSRATRTPFPSEVKCTVTSYKTVEHIAVALGNVAPTAGSVLTLAHPLYQYQSVSNHLLLRPYLGNYTPSCSFAI